jgi:hypothetical protein
MTIGIHVIRSCHFLYIFRSIHYMIASSDLNTPFTVVLNPVNEILLVLQYLRDPISMKLFYGNKCIYEGI